MGIAIKLIPVVFVIYLADATGLECYSCLSTPTVYNEDCANGSTRVKYGTCPSTYKFCIVQHSRFPDGNTSVLRDCAFSEVQFLSSVEDPQLTKQVQEITSQRTCNYNLCNASPALAYKPYWIMMAGVVAIMSSLK